MRGPERLRITLGDGSAERLWVPLGDGGGAEGFWLGVPNVKKVASLVSIECGLGCLNSPLGDSGAERLRVTLRHRGAKRLWITLGDCCSERLRIAL